MACKLSSSAEYQQQAEQVKTIWLPHSCILAQGLLQAPPLMLKARDLLNATLPLLQAACRVCQTHTDQRPQPEQLAQVLLQAEPCVPKSLHRPTLGVFVSAGRSLHIRLHPALPPAHRTSGESPPALLHKVSHLDR